MTLRVAVATPKSSPSPERVCTMKTYSSGSTSAPSKVQSMVWLSDRLTAPLMTVPVFLFLRATNSSDFEVSMAMSLPAMYSGSPTLISSYSPVRVSRTESMDGFAPSSCSRHPPPRQSS